MTIETLEKDFNDVISEGSHITENDIVEDFRDILYTPNASQNISNFREKKMEVAIQ